MYKVLLFEAANDIFCTYSLKTNYFLRWILRENCIKLAVCF